MKIKKKKHTHNVYIFFIFLSLIIFFFSTTKVDSKGFFIDNIEVSKPFEINFDKNKVIDEGFNKAFYELVSLLVTTKDKKKINIIKLNKIKSMIESFSIKEEKFINEIYFVNLGVTFNKKKIFNYLTQKNIFPSTPNQQKFLFIPIIIDEKKRNLNIFNNNKIYSEWNKSPKSYHLIEYVLPTEDLEDLNIIKKRYEIIEQYDFKEITEKYFLKNSIITLIFKNDRDIRILSRITNKNDVKLKNQTISNVDFEDQEQIKKIINELKDFYEDSWKEENQINTSIKLSLTVKISTDDNIKISNFEKVLDELDLVYNFSIYKFDNNFVYYQIIFNGTPSLFLNLMNDKDYNINTNNKLWILK